MIKLLVDSSSDYETEEINAKGFYFVPITVNINGRDYVDGMDLQKNEFFEMLTNGCDFPQTSQPSPSSFLAIFQEAKEKGDEVICILLSSELSGTVQSAILAKNMADYSGIYIIDSLSASYPIKIMADYAYRLIQEGLPAKEIVKKVEALRPRVKLFAVLDTLEYLSKGGRLSKSAAAIGEMANIKPVITLTEEGKVGVLGKCLGKNKAIAQLLKHVKEWEHDSDFPFYTIYSYGLNNCTLFEEKLTENNYSIDERLQIGATIGAHIGPEAFGVIIVAKE